MNELIIIGKTINTFGIKGELKVISNFEKQDEAFLVNKKILINNMEHTITSIRRHKNYILMGIDNLDNINLVLDYVGYNIYMARDELNLKSDDYLYDDLINAKVFDDNEEELGVIIDIKYGGVYDYVCVKGSKEFLIPLIDVYVDNFSKDEKILYTKNARDLII